MIARQGLRLGLLVLLGLPALTACSSTSDSAGAKGTTTPGEVKGSVAGMPVTVKEQSAFHREDAANGVVPQTEIRLADFAGLCALEQSGGNKANGAAMVLQLKVDPVVLGTFPVADNMQVEYKVRDATCNDTKTGADSGTITITAVSATQIEGSFDAMFGTDHVSGSFAAPMCAGVPANPSGGGCAP